MVPAPFPWSSGGRTLVAGVSLRQFHANLEIRNLKHVFVLQHLGVEKTRDIADAAQDRGRLCLSEAASVLMPVAAVWRCESLLNKQT